MKELKMFKVKHYEHVYGEFDVLATDIDSAREKFQRQRAAGEIDFSNLVMLDSKDEVEEGAVNGELASREVTELWSETT